MIQKEVSFLVWLDVKMWINILNIAFLWRSGNSDLVKQPEIQSWITFVLYDLRWVYMYFCLPENSLYISVFFFQWKKNQWRRKRKFNSQRLQRGKLNKEKCELSRKNWTKEKGLSIWMSSLTFHIFELLLHNHLMNFNETWPKASTQGSLPRLCSRCQSVSKHGWPDLFSSATSVWISVKLDKTI